MKDILVLPSFILAIFSFLVSGWVALQIGRLDFERRRQSFLTTDQTFHTECAAKIYELETLISRLDRFSADVLLAVDSVILEDYSNCREAFTLRIDGLTTVIAAGKASHVVIEKLAGGLKDRVDLERLVGGAERNQASIADRIWGQKLVEWAAEVTAIEERVKAVSTPDPSIERTCPGIPGTAAHVKR